MSDDISDKTKELIVEMLDDPRCDITTMGVSVSVEDLLTNKKKFLKFGVYIQPNALRSFDTNQIYDHWILKRFIRFQN